MRSFAIGLFTFFLLTTVPQSSWGGTDKGDANEAPATSAGPTDIKTPAPKENASASSDPASEIELLKQMLEQQEARYEEQRAINADQQKRLTALESELSVMRGAATGPPTMAVAVNNVSPSTASTADQHKSSEDKDDVSPLFFKIGRANFTPGGFLDFTTIFRSKTVGSGLATTFGTIPYNVAASYPAAGLSELRMSNQNSRVSLKVDSEVGKAKVTGELETDFLGYNATTMDITSNSATLRLRLAFVDVSMGKWEVLGGQDWSLLTPNRKGLSPMTNDVFYSLDGDANYQMGVVWARQPQLRVVYHPNDSWAIGFSAENPQQFIGNALTLPTGFTSTQADTNGATWGANTNTPNLHPDLIAKIAYDTKVGGRSFHLDAAGIYRTFKINTFIPATSSAAQASINSTAGAGGGSLNANLELFKNFHLIENAFWSDGGGRYILGLAPDFVVQPANADGAYTISPVHAGSGLLGFEWQAVPRVTLFGYYSVLYAGRNYSTVAPNTACGSSGYCGYGFPGSTSTTNRDIQESTFGVSRTFWSNPGLGKLQGQVQLSYVTRNPWSIAAGTPGGANLLMSFITMRYYLP